MNFCGVGATVAFYAVRDDLGVRPSLLLNSLCNTLRWFCLVVPASRPGSKQAYRDAFPAPNRRAGLQPMAAGRGFYYCLQHFGLLLARCRFHSVIARDSTQLNGGDRGDWGTHPRDDSQRIEMGNSTSCNLRFRMRPARNWTASAPLGNPAGALTCRGGDSKLRYRRAHRPS